MPANIMSIAKAEVISLHQFAAGMVTVRTSRWGDCTYALDADARRFIAMVLL